MITMVLLLPVVAVLLWLYWYLLPGRRWNLQDTLLLLLLTLLAAVFNHLALNAQYESGGPLWPQLISVVGVYAIFALGLSAGLSWRRRRDSVKAS